MELRKPRQQHFLLLLPMGLATLTKATGPAVQQTDVKSQIGELLADTEDQLHVL